MPETLQKYEQDRWTLEDGVMQAEDVVGTRLRHFYSATWDVDLSAVGLSLGAAMPDRPASGKGSAAFVVSVTRGALSGTSRRLIEVIGFDPEEYS